MVRKNEPGWSEIELYKALTSQASAVFSLNDDGDSARLKSVNTKWVKNLNY
jgi:hypothetical protein